MNFSLNLIVHFGAFKDATELDGFINRYGKEGTERGSILDVELGLAFLPSVPFETISLYVHRVDFIQVMGIERIGFQGETFNEKALALIKSVHTAYPDVIISVDGGVHADNAEQIFEAGANRLVVGSAIFNQPNASEITEAFVHLTHDHDQG
jgi:ribulose-phosphate 3-epimerase